jgi:DNA-binding response OmpR family regulator
MSGLQRKDEWREFGLRAVREPDPVKRAALVAELNGLLQSQVREFGSIRVDLGQTQVTRDGKPVNLSHQEFQLFDT